MGQKRRPSEGNIVTNELSVALAIQTNTGNAVFRDESEKRFRPWLSE
jgi:hypothetical protein